MLMSALENSCKVYKSCWINVRKYKKNSRSPRATANQPLDKNIFPGEKNRLCLCRLVSLK